MDRMIPGAVLIGAVHCVHFQLRDSVTSVRFDGVHAYHALHHRPGAETQNAGAIFVSVFEIKCRLMRSH